MTGDSRPNRPRFGPRLRVIPDSRVGILERNGKIREDPPGKIAPRQKNGDLPLDARGNEILNETTGRADVSHIRRKSRIFTRQLTAVAAICAAQAAFSASPTPAALDIQTLADTDQALTFALRGRLAEGGSVDILFHCDRTRGGEFTVHGRFGSWPPDDRPVQFGVRNPWGETWHGGTPASASSTRADTHAPILAGSDAVEAADRVLVDGTLVSNGWRSVWIHVAQERLDIARDRVEGCRTVSDREDS